jgi:Tfp pilus assembly protein PilW
MNYELRIKKSRNTGFTPTLTFTKQRSCALGAHCKSKCRGFTIIETMIAVSLFIIIVMMGMGALLNANALHQKSQNMRSIIDNLSFVMEDMSRNLRVGYSYDCILPNGAIPDTPIPVSGSNCGGIAFKSTANNTISTWVYYLSGNPSHNTSSSIFKKVSGGTPVQLTPDEVEINSASSFTVVGAEPPPDDTKQPFVTIKLVGTITSNKVVTPFSLQTSVSQRQIDI